MTPRPIVFRVVTGVLLALLVAALWMPRAWALELHVNNSPLQAVLSAIVAVCLTEAFAIRTADFNVVRKVRAVALALVVLLAVLEAGQMFVGRHADFIEFFYNAAAAVFAVFVLFAYRRHHAPPRAISRPRIDHA